MNIFKKIKLANKLINIYSEVKKHLENTHLTENIKINVEAIREALKNLAKEIPAVQELIEIIF